MGKDYNNPMMYYFDSGTTTAAVMSDLAHGFSKGSIGTIDDKIMNRTQREIEKHRREIDAATYPFSHDLYRHVFGKKTKKRLLLLVGGEFYGSAKPMETLLPIDLGVNPYRLYSRNIPLSFTTMDEYITEEKTREYLEKNKEVITEKGFSVFKVKSSRFFYVLEESLAGLLDENGNINHVEAVPLISPVHGHVGLDKAVSPNLDSYSDKGFPFMSYRLKHTLTKKLLKRFNSKVRSNKYTLISDWVANRVILATEEDVKQLGKFLESSPEIGRSQVYHLMTKDYYAKPKKNGFRSMNMVFRINTPGYHEIVREIQLVDMAQYYANEIDPKSSARHNLHKIKQARISKKRKQATTDLENVLLKMFGQDETAHVI